MVGVHRRAQRVHEPLRGVGGEVHQLPGARGQRAEHLDVQQHLTVRAVRAALRRVGAAVHGGGLDTFTDPRLYSYRRDGETGRFASLVWRTAG